ncbi:ParB family chromosome partitioning protein [Lactobacillus colini]|uniref:ParB family chromosome partitioning protein n=1 Tax=Lactobacillus colini TaxID=1819254 RepID=A0ABS4MEV4_9LACO|nr:nucleoid occlusion protein [Lactobacillus colini]MBP2058153.1 ParB family chromosome partitioning protein [Lactobacillus colini]
MGLFFNRKNTVPKEKQIQEISLDKIIPNPYQPRHAFSEDSINELAQTLQEQGLLQPIILREHQGDDAEYEIIAGERRYRAAKSLGWDKISAIVEEMDDEKVASLAVIENLQREDLNPIDEAEAYVKLMETNDLTQTELAQQVGKSQSYIANKIRLLKLSDKVQKLLVDGTLSQRHGRALLALEPADQDRAAEIIIADGLNVKKTEEMAKDIDGYLAAKQVDQKAPKKATKKEKTVVNTKPTKDFKVQINTIKKAIKMAKDSGMKVKYTEDKGKDSYKITIEMLRK